MYFLGLLLPVLMTLKIALSFPNQSSAQIPLLGFLSTYIQLPARHMSPGCPTGISNKRTGRNYFLNQLLRLAGTSPPIFPISLQNPNAEK